MKKPGVKKNFGYNMVYQIFLMILPLVTTPYIARVLGAEGVGIYSYTYSIAHYFVLFGILGTDNYGNNCIAKIRDDTQKRNTVFSEIYSMQLIISLTAAAAYLMYALFWAQHRQYALIQGLYVLTAVVDISWLFCGMEDFRLTVTKQISIKVFTLVAIFVFVRTSADLWKYIAILSGGQLLAQMSMCFFVRRYVRFAFSGIRRAMQHLKEIVILFIPVVATSVYRIMDKVMLGAMSSMAQVGYYEGSEKLINVCLCVIGSFGAVMMPRMSNLLGRGKEEECKELFVRSMEIALFIGFAIAFGISSVADIFVPVFYGSGYDQSIGITVLLSVTVPFITWACIVRMLYLLPAQRNRVYIQSVFTGAAANVIVNALLIPQYGAAGAAVGTICAETLVAVSQTMMVNKELDIVKCLRQSLPFLLFGILMWGAVKLIPASLGSVGLTLTVKISVGAAMYLACSGLYFIATKNQLAMGFIWQIRNKIRHK